MSNSITNNKMDSPPVISDNALPSTPAREWANNTTSSLNANNNSTPHGQEVSWMFDSSASTPEGDLPGAYPSGIDRGSTFDPKGAAIGVYNTAKSYIPAQDNMGKAALSASETVKHYLPQSVASYFPSSPVSGAGDGKNYSLPSKELSDEGLGTTNRVSSLPGPGIEPGIAILPDERFENDETIDEKSSSSLKDMAEPSLLPRKRSSGSDNLANSTASNGVDTSYLTPRTNSNHTNGDSLSDISTQAQDGSEISTTSPLNTPTVAPSPYPAGPNEGAVKSDVARYASVSGDTLHPEQRKDSSGGAVDAAADDLASSRSVQQPILNTMPRTHPLAGDGAKWKGVPLSEGYQSQLDANEERQLNQGARDNRGPSQMQELYEESKSGEAKDEAHAFKNKALGTDDGKPASTGSDVNTNTNSTIADAGHSPEVRPLRDGSSTKFHSMASPRDHKVDATVPTPSEVGKGNGHGSPGKSKFMDRIKGEVKVISGKLAHNDGKVEEGRRLMGKGV